jgi:O-antigen ligase
MGKQRLGSSSDNSGLLLGTSAVALTLAATRWGTNIGISPLFLTDVLLLLGLISALLVTRKRGIGPLSGFTGRHRPSALFVVYFLYVIARFLFSISNGPLADWVRDGAPFLYGFLAFVSAGAIARSTEAMRARTMLVFWWALGAHVAWMLAVTFTGWSGLATPLGVLFQMRPDIDAAILGVGAGLFLLQLFRVKKKIWPAMALAGSLVGVLSMGSRAALISLVLSLTLAFAIRYSATAKKRASRVFLQLALPVLVVGILVALPFTTQGERLLATIGNTQGESANQASAAGTEQARQLVWNGIFEWVGEDTPRVFLGSGFGNDFLAQSGTLTYLEGTTYNNVRSPHNWFVGIYARMGIVGLALAVMVCLQLLLTIVRNRQKMASEPLLATAGLLVVAVIPVAILGVVLEAPFGAVPFWWAAGIVFALRSDAPPRARSTSPTGRSQRTLAK